MSYTLARWLAAALACLVVSTASAQDEAAAKQAAREKMKPLEGMLGRWEGEGAVTPGPGRAVNVHQTEEVRRKLGGVGFCIEGRGAKQVVFDAGAGQRRRRLQRVAVPRLP